MEGVIGGCARFSTTLVAIQTQINRGGTLELMIEDGGWRRVGGAGCALRSPGALKSEGAEAHYAHSERSLQRRLPRCSCLSSKLFLVSFPQLVTTLHRLEASGVGWLHGYVKSFHGLGNWKTFSGAFIGARRLFSYCGLLTYRRTFGSYLLG